ncbi:AGE family epimerase/isomerase [Uliginosibacterium gangwonense]|uniref:AGE family epimerase/isomerase n=1 Tax=Uliginosibacterium gangwonense TaxID=392736 RepID=UPI00037AF9AB|nr:AGE family epimerase/isomerase [Uliginosibacterium gangwonense]
MILSAVRSREFLLEQIRYALGFYHPRALDRSGGFFQHFNEDGSIADPRARHLASSARFVCNYAVAARWFKDVHYREAAEHGLRFIEQAHRDPRNSTYAWEINWQDGSREVVNATTYCYGLALTLQAYAQALQAGIKEAAKPLRDVFKLMNEHFWDAAAGLYADDADANWKVSPYRGQNANLHACEALLAAYEATSDYAYLERAQELAYNITVGRASLANGLIWEHYHADWTPDWNYNRDRQGLAQRPWGYQPGHHVQWARLLLILERHRNLPWLALRAEALFDEAVNNAWDEEFGGLQAAFAPDKTICDQDKYYWVQAEAIASAALIAMRKGKEEYWIWYERIWKYCQQYFLNAQQGTWHRVLSRDNKHYTASSLSALKTDFHLIHACNEVINRLNQE